MYLVYCSDNEPFEQDRLKDKTWSKFFPGAGWITCMYEISVSYGVQISSGDIALKNVIAGKWDVKQIYVIQELESTTASKLLQLGAIPFLITCLEASIYAPNFYDNIDSISKKFKFKLGFGFKDSVSPNKLEQKVWFRFPSFYANDIRKIGSISDRKRIALVASNKYKTESVFITRPLRFVGLLRLLKSLFQRFFSPSLRMALKSSLHDKRLEAIVYFAGEKDFDLYGPGWSNLGSLPKEWVEPMNSVVERCYVGTCVDKIQVLCGYRFYLCFENMDSPGYVTEKIIDCFVAGTVPLYWGTQDVKKLIPAEAFIDMRDFSSFSELSTYINLLSDQDLLKIIEAGREYLKSENGHLHSYEGFANQVLKLVKEC